MHHTTNDTHAQCIRNLLHTCSSMMVVMIYTVVLAACTCCIAVLMHSDYPIDSYCTTGSLPLSRRSHACVCIQYLYCLWCYAQWWTSYIMRIHVPCSILCQCTGLVHSSHLHRKRYNQWYPMHTTVFMRIQGMRYYISTSSNRITMLLVWCD